MKAGAGSGRTHVRRSRPLAHHHRSAWTGNCFSRSGGRWKRLSLRTAFWRDAGYDVERTERHAGIDF